MLLLSLVDCNAGKLDFSMSTEKHAYMLNSKTCKYTELLPSPFIPQPVSVIICKYSELSQASIEEC